MRRRIDAARQARRHHQPGEAQVARQSVGELAGQGTGVAGAHNGDHFLFQQMRMTQHADQGRRRVQCGQAVRVLGFTGCNHAPAQFGQGFQFARGIGRIRQHEGFAAAAFGHLRQGVQRGACRAEAGDQIVEGDRADAVGARQTQPVAAFGVSELVHFQFRTFLMACRFAT